jgi:hypothetical protein
MLFTKVFFYLFVSIIFCTILQYVQCYSIQYPVRSDAIVTKWPQNQEIVPEDKQPGWMVSRKKIKNLNIKVSSKVSKYEKCLVEKTTDEVR